MAEGAVADANAQQQASPGSPAETIGGRKRGTSPVSPDDSKRGRREELDDVKSSRIKTTSRHRESDRDRNREAGEKYSHSRREREREREKDRERSRGDRERDRRSSRDDYRDRDEHRKRSRGKDHHHRERVREKDDVKASGGSDEREKDQQQRKESESQQLQAALNGPEASEPHSSAAATMKAPEPVIPSSGGAALTADAKKKLLWAGKKEQGPSNPVGKTPWDSVQFADRERQEKFHKLMGLKTKQEEGPQAEACEESQRVMQEDLEKQFTAGLRRRDGRTVGLGL